MSSGFTLEFLRNYIKVRQQEDYVITPESQRQLWEAIGQACKKYQCWRVLAESPAYLQHRMNRSDVFRSAQQAAKISNKLRVACVQFGYDKDETIEFFINVAYKMGVRIEFFSDRETAIDWLGTDDEVTR
jgi:hypothetical protein